jgi:uncharacterized membrane protein
MLRLLLKMFLLGSTSIIEAINYKNKQNLDKAGALREKHNMSEPNKTSSPLKWVLRIFLTGLITILPLAATFIILVLAGSMIYDWLGPNSWFGKIVTFLGIGGGDYLRYFFGLLVIGTAIFGLGLLTEKGLQKGLQKLVDSVILKIPLVRTIYETTSHFVGLLSKKPDDKMQGMSPVWCYFGGEGGVVLLALLSTPELIKIGEHSYHSVIIPTAPVPIGGGVFFVPESWVKPANIGIEGLTSIYVSMGATAPATINP